MGGRHHRISVRRLLFIVGCIIAAQAVAQAVGAVPTRATGAEVTNLRLSTSTPIARLPLWVPLPAAPPVRGCTARRW